MRAWMVTTLVITLLSASSARAIDAQADSAQGDSKKPATARIDVEVSGFRNTKGQALIALFTSKKGFPNQGKLALRQKAMKIPGKSLRYSFEKIKPGVVAIAVLHDENMNFKMDTNFFGMPKESYGVSNNARNRFGPPSWKDARFEVKAGQTIKVKIRLIH